jgi:hypothetical protein
MRLFAGRIGTSGGDAGRYVRSLTLDASRKGEPVAVLMGAVLIISAEFSAVELGEGAVELAVEHVLVADELEDFFGRGKGGGKGAVFHA